MLLTPPITTHTHVTPDEFDARVDDADNRSLNLELLYGRIIEKMVSSPRSSQLGNRISGFLFMHIYPRKSGRLTGADGGYWIGGNRVIPDCAFVSNAKRNAPVVGGYATEPPDIAVEVISPSDTHDDIQDKIQVYREGGVLLWLVDPKRNRLTVYDGMAEPVELTTIDTLNGGRVLPDFTLALVELFADDLA